MRVSTSGGWGAFVLMLALSSCGGGGSGGGVPPSTTPPNDGLGASGQVAGTVTVPSAAIATVPSAATAATNAGIPRMTFDDSGRVLMVFRNTDDAGNISFSWTSGDLSGNWHVADTLSLTPTPVLMFEGALRGNSSGDAVLAVTYEDAPPPGAFSGATFNRLLRYSPSTGWAAATDLPSSRNNLSFIPFTASSDVSVLDDGTIVLSVIGDATSPSSGNTRSLWVAKRGIADNDWTLIESAPTSAPIWSYLATTPAGAGTLFSVDDGPSSQPPSQVFRTQGVDIPDEKFLFSPEFLPLGGFSFCAPSPIAIASTAAQLLAVLHQTNDTGCDQFHSDLDLVRLDAFGVAVQRMNAADASAFSPNLAMNDGGDMLAVWTELSPGTANARLLWAQALHGATRWGNPAPVLADAPFRDDVLPSTLSFAANRSGHVAAAAFFHASPFDYIAVGRFSFAAGWTWQRVASMLEMSQPTVAINAKGEAILVYSARACERGSIFFNCKADREMYMLKF